MAVFENWALKTWLLPTPHEAPWRVRSYSRLTLDEDLETDFGVIRVIQKISQVLKSSLEKKLEWSDFPESFNSGKIHHVSWENPLFLWPFCMFTRG